MRIINYILLTIHIIACSSCTIYFVSSSEETTSKIIYIVLGVVFLVGVPLGIYLQNLDYKDPNDPVNVLKDIRDGVNHANTMDFLDRIFKKRIS